MKEAIYVECPGVTNDGEFGHSMRDNCWSCAPYWEKYPACPIHKTMLLTSTRHGLEKGGKAKCRKCNKFYIFVNK